MRNRTCIIIVFFCSTLEVFAQISPKFTLDKDHLTIKRDLTTSNDLKVYRGQISEEELSSTHSILGKVVKGENIIRFIPEVSFAWDQQYTFVHDNIIDYFTINIPEAYEYLTIKAVYPSAKELPTNLLKWYIKFSKPINEVYVYNHIKFTTITGDTLSRVSLPVENALISNNGRLLTVWIEPGRQKRGLIPNQQLGPVFEHDVSYKLIILKNLKDKNGIAMQEDFVHQFEITTVDRIQPNINTWEIVPPKINTISNLIIKCLESLDYGSALNDTTIIDSEENEIMGYWKLTDYESTLVFTPMQPWDKGNYRILLNPKLEDLAGNNLNRLFDSEISNVSDIEDSPKEYKIEFRVE